MRVGFIGLGRMGAPMVRNLARGNLEVSLWNRTLDKAQTLSAEIGARVADSPAGLARTCDVVITVLENDEAVIDVFERPDGLLSGLTSGKIVVDMSTVGPWTTERISLQVAEKGAVLIDAPVSGSVPAAEGATLMIMPAGPDEALDKTEPILALMGNPVIRMGSSGAGATIKLAINAIVFALNQALSEVLVLAERAGVDRELAYTAFQNSAIRSPLIGNRRDVYISPGTTPVYFTNALVVKDLELALRLAGEVGADLPMAKASLEMVKAAVQAGFGDADMGMAAVYMRDHHQVNHIPE